MDKAHAPAAISVETKALLSRTPAVIESGHTFESVTETIGHVVLSKRTPIGWFLGFFIAFMLLMVLNMIQQGIFGEIIHCEAGYQHDVRGGTLRDGNLRWRTMHAVRRNANLYPTHPMGPMAWWMGINRGDRITYLVSMSSKSRGMNHYVAKHYGADHPNAKLKFARERSQFNRNGRPGKTAYQQLANRAADRIGHAPIIVLL